MTIMLLWLVPTVVALALLMVAGARPMVRFAKLLAEAAAGLLVAALPFIIATPYSPATKTILFIAQLWALLLPARIIFGRLNKEFVLPSTRRNSAFTLGIIGAIVAGSFVLSFFPQLHGDYEWRLLALLGLAFVLQMIFFAQLLWTSRHYKMQLDNTHRPFKELPTVSICIPARNETRVLQECLENVLGSTYPKLEFIVLDDCSQDKTSQVIRAFAHDGVRFIKGSVPASGWLGKNQAMQTLAEHASGDYLLYMGVDTRLSPNSVAQIVDYALDNSVGMVAILPQNRLGLRAGALFGTLQYFWQMVLPITRRRVPLANQCWLIEADMLRELGGFKSVAHKIMPEGSFARRLHSWGKYRFIASGAALGVTTAKRWHSQAETSIRILYPTLRRQPMFALVALSILAASFLMPFITMTWLLATGQLGGLFVVSLVVCLMILSNYALTLQRTHPRSWLLVALLFPFAITQEIIVLVASMLLYEFGEINWKGRNVCYPVIGAPHQRQPAQPESAD